MNGSTDDTGARPGQPAADDDLLRPSIPRDTGKPPDALPWRLGSQLWVGFFGGVLPLMFISQENARRLGCSTTERLRVVWVGALALLAIGVGVGLLHAFWAGDERMGTRLMRLVSKLGGVLLWLLFRTWQGSADRIHAYRHQGRYASLWIYGLGAVFGIGFVQGLYLHVVRLLVDVLMEG